MCGPLGATDWEEELLDLSPPGDAGIAVDGSIVGGGKQNPLPLESLEVPVGVVDQVVGQQDAFVTAKHKMRGRNEGEVPAQPPVFRAKGVGELHGRGGNEYLVMRRELGENFLAVLKDRQVLKEIFTAQITIEPFMPVGGD